MVLFLASPDETCGSKGREEGREVRGLKTKGFSQARGFSLFPTLASTGFIRRSQKESQAFSSSQKKGPHLGNSEKGKKKKKMAGVAEDDPEVPPSTILAFPVRAGPAREGGERTYQYWPFSTSDLYNWKTQTPSFSEKPQGLIDLLESILFTHNPT